MPPEVDQQKSPERTPDLTRSQNPDDIIREMAVRDLRINYQQEKVQITSNAAAERAKTLGDVAPNIDTKPEQKTGDSAKATPEKQPAPAAPEQPAAKAETPPSASGSAPAATAEAANSPQKPEEKKKFMDQVKEFFSKMWAPIGAFFTSVGDKFKDWFGKIFKKKDSADAGSPSASPSATANSPTAAPTASKSPAQSPPVVEKPAGADETWGLKGNALFNNPQFKARNEEIASKIGCSAADLNAIYMMESGGNPQCPPNKVGTAGLIQWIPPVARSMYGLETSQIRAMSGLQQLDLVERFFRPYFGKLRSFSDLYRATFYPASIGKPSNWIFGSERSMEWAQKVAQQNSGIAKACGRPDGLIDNAGFEAFCGRKKPKDSGFNGSSQAVA